MKEVFKGARRSVDYGCPKIAINAPTTKLNRASNLAEYVMNRGLWVSYHAVLAPFLAVDFPRRTELVYECAVALRPKRFLQRHFY